MLSMMFCIVLAMVALQSTASSIEEIVTSTAYEMSSLATLTSRTASFMTAVAQKLPNLFSGPRVTIEEFQEIANKIAYCEDVVPRLSSDLKDRVTAFANASKCFVQTMTEMNVYADATSQRRLLNTMMLSNFEPRMRSDYDLMQTTCQALVAGAQEAASACLYTGLADIASLVGRDDRQSELLSFLRYRWMNPLMKLVAFLQLSGSD